jgi:predicted nucleotidyltransferase
MYFAGMLASELALKPALTGASAGWLGRHAGSRQGRYGRTFMSDYVGNLLLEAIGQSETIREEYESGKLKVLFACESGSRSWGLASPNSDHDIRFVYRRNTTHYLALNKQRDVIEFNAQTNDYEPIPIEVMGWDIAKYLSLLVNGNASAYEWPRCPLYMKDPGWMKKRKEIEEFYFQPFKVAQHYRGLARKHLYKYIADKEEVSCKRYLYLFRALYSLQWILERKTMPPIRFYYLMNELATDEEFHDVMTLVARKQGGEENIMVPTDKDRNLNIENKLETLTEILNSQDTVWVSGKTDWKPANDFLVWSLTR